MSVSKEKGILRLDGITSNQIFSLLKAKHSNDVIVPECKNGETWGAHDLLKMDAWVLCRTYSPLTTIGYEIKCSRQDFEQDQKWTKYLDLCHLFYFVCPAGLIRATDLPSQVGIIWVSKDRLHIKRKAERVTPDTAKLNKLLIYVVMARSKIVDSMYERDVEPKGKLEQKREWVETAQAKKELAFFIKGHVQKMYGILTKKEVDLAVREGYIKDFESRLARLGIKWDSEKGGWTETYRVLSEIDLLKQRIDSRTLQNMREASRVLTELVETIDTYRSEGSDKAAAVKREEPS